MSTTRRTILSGALAAPLLAQFTTMADGATPGDKWGKVSDAWVEIHWTPQAQEQLNRFQAKVEAIAPAKLITDKDRPGVRLPVRSGTGDPALDNLPQAQGSGLLDGGLVVRTPSGEFRATSLEGTLLDERVSGKCAVNGIDVGAQSVFTCTFGEGRLAVEPAPPGQPLTIRLTDVPVRLTQESLETLASTLGEHTLTKNTVLGHATAHGVYTPPLR